MVLSAHTDHIQRFTMLKKKSNEESTDIGGDISVLLLTLFVKTVFSLLNKKKGTFLRMGLFFGIF